VYDLHCDRSAAGTSPHNALQFVDADGPDRDDASFTVPTIVVDFSNFRGGVFMDVIREKKLLHAPPT
jgi:hypothetical protein